MMSLTNINVAPFCFHFFIHFNFFNPQLRIIKDKLYLVLILDIIVLKMSIICIKLFSLKELYFGA